MQVVLSMTIKLRAILTLGVGWVLFCPALQGQVNDRVNDRTAIQPVYTPTRRADATELAKDNYSRVAASSVQIRAVLVRTPDYGRTSRWVAKEATTTDRLSRIKALPTAILTGLTGTRRFGRSPLVATALRLSDARRTRIGLSQRTRPSHQGARKAFRCTRGGAGQSALTPGEKKSQEVERTKHVIHRKTELRKGRSTIDSPTARCDDQQIPETSPPCRCCRLIRHPFHHN
jgi:hypothetical protein